MPQLYTETLGAGPELVLLHGWGMNSTIWRPILRPLAKKYRVTCIDLPGHGYSPEVEWGAAQATEWLLAAAPSRACWIGWSLGGMLAIMAAMKCPERVSGLLTVATNLRFTRADSWPSAMPGDQLLRFAKALEHDPLAVLKRFIALQFLGVSVEKKIIKRLQDDVVARQISSDTLRQGFELLRQLDLRDAFQTLELPVQALFGRLDKLVPVQAAAAIQALNPAAQVSIFMRAGHAPFISHPFQFIEQVDSFVGQ